MSRGDHIWLPAKCRELVQPCAGARPGGSRYPGKVTRHKVIQQKVFAQGCRHKGLAPGHEHISWPQTEFMESIGLQLFDVGESYLF